MSIGERADHRIEIDGLRAIAVISVVLYHLGVPGLAGGFVGVDVFFVISGFLITGKLSREIVQTGRIGVAAFYIGRIRRLFPALFVTVVGSFVAGLAILGPTEFAQLSGSAVHSLVWLSNFFFWAEAGYFDTSGTTKPLLHTWSLSVEE